MKKAEFENALTEVRDEFILEAARTPKRVNRKRLGLIIAAAMFVVLTLGANAAAPVNLGFYLAAAFGDNYSMVNEMTAIPDNVAYRSSGDEIRLELKGIVGDSQVVHVFADFTIAADVALPEDETFTILARLKPTGVPWEDGIGSYGASGGPLGMTVNEDGSRTYEYRFTLRSRNQVFASNYAIQCEGIARLDKAARMPVPILSGRWNAAFSLNYKDLTRTAPLDVVGRLHAEDHEDSSLIHESEPVYVHEIRWSPLSLSIYYTADHDFSFAGKGTLTDIELEFADGTRLTREQGLGSVGGGGGTDGPDSDWNGYNMIVFSTPIDADQLVSVRFGGIEITMP